MIAPEARWKPETSEAETIVFVGRFDRHKGGDLVIDAFDNSTSRQAVQHHARQTKVPCLHAGLFEDYCEIIWDEQYRVPSEAVNAPAVCDYPLARNIVLLAVAIASETVVQFITDASRVSRSATLRDFGVRVLDVPILDSLRAR